MVDPRYPIGRPEIPQAATPELRAAWTAHIAAAPQLVRAAVAGLTDAQLDTPYREGGWSVRQVVHHLADSHLHAFLRFKSALAEQAPEVKAYDEKVWAAMADAAHGPLEPSLLLIDGLHQRWVNLIHTLDAAQFARTIRHPERGPLTLDALLAIYSWHGRHHAAQITALRERNGW